MPKFKRGGAGTPAIMEAPTPPAPPVDESGAVKGARSPRVAAQPSPVLDPDSAADLVDPTTTKKPRKPRNPNAAPKKTPDAQV